MINGRNTARKPLSLATNLPRIRKLLWRLEYVCAPGSSARKSLDKFVERIEKGDKLRAQDAVVIEDMYKEHVQNNPSRVFY